MSLYDDMRKLTGDLMREFKQGTIAYRQMVPGSGPIDDPGDPTPVDSAINAAVRGVSFKYIQNGLASASDLQVTFAGDALANDPQLKDFVVVDGIQYKIVQIIRKPAAGKPVAYTLIVRK